jgi:hypothetical protein
MQKQPTTPEALATLAKGQPSIQELRKTVLEEGLDELSDQQKLLLLSDAECVGELHRELWRQPRRTMPPTSAGHSNAAMPPEGRQGRQGRPSDLLSFRQSH